MNLFNRNQHDGAWQDDGDHPFARLNQESANPDAGTTTATRLIKYEIYTPSPGAFLVCANGRVVENWRELQEAARQAAEPAVVARWQAHWQHVLNIVSQSMYAKDLPTLMTYIYTPDMYFPCPDDLAARAIVASHQRT